MTDTHGALMDDIYRTQRLFYDVTRKYYLLGRDHLIAEIKADSGARVLEVACGTGRNLAAIGRKYPEADLYGLDISEQMLTTARAKLDGQAKLALGDACDFDPEAMFGQAKFDHIVLSYSVSMIPDWQGALREATRHLATGGTLHVVDFGGQERMPSWFRKLLLGWLAKFHVEPRYDAQLVMQGLADEVGATLTFSPLFRTYAQWGQLTLRP